MRWRHLPRTTPEAHLAGIDALRIDDPRRLTGGDWHKSSHWQFIIEYEWPEEVAPTAMDCPYWGEVLDALGTERVIDVREAFTAMQHPDAEPDSPVWAAAHERAVVEVAWATVRRLGTIGSMHYPLRELGRWVNQHEPNEWSIAALNRMTGELKGQGREDWTTWVERWRIASRLRMDDDASTLSPLEADVLNEIEAF